MPQFERLICKSYTEIKESVISVTNAPLFRTCSACMPEAIAALLAAGLLFIFPVSKLPNAIVYGLGMIPITRMIRAGILFDLTGGLTIWLGLRPASATGRTCLKNRN